MKNKLIVAALLLANVISVSAMEGDAQSAEASKILIQNGAIKVRTTPIVSATGTHTYEGLTADDKLIRVRFDREGLLDKTFGKGGVQIIENVEFSTPLPTAQVDKLQ